MKISLLKIVVYVAMLAVFGLLTRCKEQAPVFQVNDVASDPGAYSKPLILEGIVYSFAKGNTSIVGVMDKKELQCNSPNCNKTLFAVKSNGVQLAIGDEIKASGTISKESWGYILNADSIVVATKHKLGA